MWHVLKQTLFGLVMGITIPTLALGQATFVPPAKQTYTTDDGKPAALGQVEMYVPGGTVKKLTWSDSNQTIPQVNPIPLDIAGRPQPGGQIFGTGSYRQIVRDANGSIIWDANTTAVGTGSGGGGGGGNVIGDGQQVGTIQIWPGLVAPAQYQFAYGQALSRTTYPELLTAITLRLSITCVPSSPLIAGIADTTQIPIGAKIEASCFAPGTTVLSKTSNTLTMSSNATVSLVVNATLFPWGNGDGATTFNAPNLNGAVPVGRNNMGGTPTSRLNSNFNSVGYFGGSETIGINRNNLPNFALTFTGTPNQPLLVTTGTSNVVQSTGVVSTTAGNSGAITALANGQSLVSAVTSAGVFTATGNIDSLNGNVIPTPTSVLQPSVSTNYIVKVTPDVSPLVATGVASIQGMTGVLTCGASLLCTGNTLNVSTGNTPFVQNFVSGSGFTPGSTTTLTLTATPSSAAMLTVMFDGVVQSHSTWSLASNVITFNNPIPTNVRGVEAQYYNAVTLTNSDFGVQSLGGAVGAIGLDSSLTITGTNLGLANYTAPMTGAVGRTIPSKLSDIVTVYDFGAKCDGTTNDTSAIQAALTNVPVGGTLNFPKRGVGVCLFNVKLTRTEPIKITCDPGVTITPMAGFSEDMMMFTGSINGAAYPTIIDGCIFGTTATATRAGVSGLVFNTTSAGYVFTRLQIRNVFIQAGTSGSGFGVYLNNNITNNPSGGITLADIGANSIIQGGVFLLDVGDNITLRGTYPYNAAPLADNNGIYIQLGFGTSGGAGSLVLDNLNFSQPGGVRIAQAYATTINGGQYEAQAPLSSGVQALVHIAGSVGTISGTRVLNTQMQANGGLENPTLLKIGNATNTLLQGNAIATPTSYSPIQNLSSSLICGPNFILSGTAAHVGGVPPASSYGGGC